MISGILELEIVKDFATGIEKKKAHISLLIGNYTALVGLNIGQNPADLPMRISQKLRHALLEPVVGVGLAFCMYATDAQHDTVFMRPNSRNIFRSPGARTHVAESGE